MKFRDTNWSDFFREQRRLLHDSEQMILDAERNAIRQETVTGADGKTVHRVTAKTWRDRCRLFWVFTRVAWAILFRGSASMAVRKPRPLP